MKNIWSIIGFYGQKNFGDDLFCFVMSFLMVKHGQEHRIQNGLINSKMKINHSCVPGFWRFIERKNSIGTFSRILSNIFAVIHAKKIVFGGGSVFGSYASYRQRALVVHIAKILRRDLHAFGVSIGPFSSNQEEKNYAELLRNFKFILVRDKVSLEIAQNHSLTAIRGSDMVWAISSIHPKRKCTARRLVIAMHRKKDIKSILNLVNFFDNFDSILIINFDSESVSVGEELKSKLVKIVPVDIEIKNYIDFEIEQVLDDISSATFVITSKLHGAITAAAYGVPFALLEYQPKCTEFSKDVNGINNFLNHGDEQLFTRNIPEIYKIRGEIDFDVEKRCDLIHSSFKKMLNA